jgi:hypothetical protein
MPNSYGPPPPVTPPRGDKAFRVNAAMTSLYEQMDGCKKSLAPGARHAVAGRLRPLMQAMAGRVRGGRPCGLARLDGSAVPVPHVVQGLVLGFRV